MHSFRIERRSCNRAGSLKPRTTRGRIGPIVWCLLAMVMGAGTAAAQSGSSYDLSRQISDLQRDLTQLQQYVYSAPAPAAGARSDGPLDLSPAYRERLEVRMTELEGQLRDLTGKVEEAAHSNRTLQGRLDKLVEDVDYRLTALERGTSRPAGEIGNGSGRPPETGGMASGGRPPQEQADGASLSASLPAGSAAEEYQRAQQLLTQSRYDDAEASLRRFLEEHPENQLSENARYWLGETYYVRKRYEEAASTFLDGYKRYPNGGKAADNLLKLGLSLSALKKDKEGCVAINKLLREHPDAPDHIRRRAEQEKQTLNCA